MRRRNYRVCVHCGDEYTRVGGASWCPECDTPYFIKRAKLIHGDRYDYRYSNYSASHEKLKIICPVHGIFKQTPGEHLSGCGCQECFGNRPYTNESFARKAIGTHGNKYDYSEVSYVNSFKKVKIRCRIHGVFKQLPSNHLLGQGCPDCSGNIKLTLDDFIRKSLEVHGERYDYSKVRYKDQLTAVHIGCKQHGVFEQLPKVHLRGNGCPECGGSRRRTAKEFIESARKRHQGKYHYDRVEYVNNKTNVTIICPIHGPFSQTPDSHLRGRECPQCAQIMRSETIEQNSKHLGQDYRGKVRLTLDDFVRKSIEAHGTRYDYSKVTYKNQLTKVRIGCKKHGFFEQIPKDHFKGVGCPQCGGSRRRTTEGFVESARKIHGRKYQYDKVEYKNRKTKVTIVCSIHGPFMQTPDTHLRGGSCPKCANIIRTNKLKSSWNLKRSS